MIIRLKKEDGDEYLCRMPDTMYEELKEQLTVLAELCEQGVLP